MKRPLITVKSLVSQRRERGGIDLPENALITPAAADWLRSSRVPVRRIAAAPEQIPEPDRYVIGNEAQPTVQTLLPLLQRRYANLEFLSCHGNMDGLMAALREVCAAVCASPQRRAVVLVRDGAPVSCVANKYPGVRAAILGQPSALFALQRELGINLLILERERTSLQQIRAAIDAFFTTPTSVAPAIEAALQGLLTGGAHAPSGGPSRGLQAARADAHGSLSARREACGSCNRCGC